MWLFCLVPFICPLFTLHPVYKSQVPSGHSPVGTHLNTSSSHFTASSHPQCPAAQSVPRSPVWILTAHYLLDHLHYTIKTLKEKEHIKVYGNTYDFVWTPGHEGIPENEHVDSLAKEAAKGKSSPCHTLPPSLHKPLPQSLSAIKLQLHQKTSLQWKKSWANSPWFAKCKSFYPFPSHKHLQFFKSFSCHYASLLVQACSGHIPLNKKAPFPKCPHCNNSQSDTLQHVLLSCPQHTAVQHTLICKFGLSSMSFSFLLTHKKATSHTLKLLASTKHLKHPQFSLPILTLSNFHSFLYFRPLVYTVLTHLFFAYISLSLNAFILSALLYA